MSRFLTPYENTPNAAQCNAQGQITRRQFEMLVDPETPMTRRRLRRRRLVLVILGMGFVGWWWLYVSAQTSWGVRGEWVVFAGAALLLVCAFILVSAVARLLWGILAITPTSDEIGESLRKLIREGTLAIQSVEGRLRFRHTNAGRNGLLCSLVVGRREFPISQALWEALHERRQGGHWVAFYLLDPNALLSVARLDELQRDMTLMAEGDSIVTGRTIAHRVDL